jgi:hypothetical protein
MDCKKAGLVWGDHQEVSAVRQERDKIGSKDGEKRVL